MVRVRGVLTVVGWIALLSAALLGLITLGDGPLGAPSLTEPATWGDWAMTRAPLDVVFAVLRLVVLGLAWYLLGVSIIGVALRLLRVARLVAVADMVTVPAVRRLLQRALSLGLATAAVTTISHSHGPAPSVAAAIEVVTPVASETVAVSIPVRGRTAVISHIGTVSEDEALPPVRPPSGRPWVTRDENPAPDTAAPSAGLPGEAATGPGPSADGPVPRTQPAPDHIAAGEWTVSSGEHFWSIAERILVESWKRPVNDQEIASYWATLIDANRQELADPENPDLIYPGQVFAVPEPPEPSVKRTEPSVAR